MGGRTTGRGRPASTLNCSLSEEVLCWPSGATRISNLSAEQSKETIRIALKTAGNRDVTLKMFANADHTLVLTRPKDAPWDFPRYAPGYFNLMASWIHRRFGSADSG